LLQNPARLVRQ